MACYEYKGKKYTESELRQHLKDEGSKIRRILEVQSDLFQKGRDKEDLISKHSGKSLEEFTSKMEKLNRQLDNKEIELDEYKKFREIYENNYNLGERFKNLPDNQFLQLLNKDSNWVTFFIKSIIQDSAKKRYEKILFPTGNTASKVEGHTTLEGFKEQQERQIKELEDKLSNINNLYDDKYLITLSKISLSPTAEFRKENGKWLHSKEQYIDDEGNTDFFDTEVTEQFVKDIIRQEKEYEIEGINNGIAAHKNELKRIEEEGFASLRPIFKFYEETVYNTLKKLYPVKQITDEYGNTWNEITITPDMQNTILLQKESDNRKPIKELNDKLTQYLNKIGWSVTSLEVYKEWYKQKYGVEDNSPELIKGLADLTNKIVAVAEGRESINTLPEEASHAILAGMMNTDLYKKLAELVVGEKIYEDTYKKYINTYRGDVNKVKFEALGKALADVLIKQYPNTTIENKSIITGLKRLIEKFLNLFRKDKNFTEEITELANEILRGNTSMVDTTLKNDGNFFELDVEKYKASNELDNLKSKLEEVIKKRITRLKIYENKGVGDYSKEEKERVDKLLKLYTNDKITLGVVEFINDIDKDAEATWKRLNKVIKDDNTIGTAKVLRELKAYVIPFNNTLKQIKADLNGLDREKYKELTDEITKISSKLDDLEILYENKVQLLVANFLFPFAKNNKDIKSPEDLVNKLKEEKDISITSRFLDSMAETTDDILGLFDKSVKIAKEKARISAFNKIRELLTLDKELTDKGIKTDFIFEKDKNGKITGNYVTEFNREDYRQARIEASKNIKARIKSQFNIELSDNEEERLEQFAKTKGLKKLYNTLWRNWILENTQPNPKATQLIEQKKQYFQDVYGEEKFKGNLRWELAFNNWLTENVVSNVDPYTGDVNTYYKGELSLPANKYKNKQYEAIMQDKLKTKYYNKIMSLKADLDRFLPESTVNAYLAPQIRKDSLERLKSDPRAFLKEAKEDLKLRETDTEFGDLRKLTDVDNKPVNFLPVHYTNRLSNMDDLSLDATATMAAYIEMAEDHKEMNKIIHVLELGEEVLSKRKVVVGESALNNIFNKLSLNKSQAYEQTTGGKSYERFKDYMDMVVYGKMKANENWLNIAGLNTVKLIDNLNKYTSISGLAANIYSGVNSTLLGNALARQEAIAGEFIDKGGLTFADKTYWGELPQFLNSVGNPYSDSKLMLVGQLMDIFQDFKEKTRNLNTDRNRFEKLISTNSLYFTNSAGEHQIQWRTALAIMHNTKVKTRSGEEINLWQALEIKDNKAQLRDDLVDFDEDDLLNVGLRIKALNQKLHGIYNDVDRSAIQKWTLGRMALVFRKWIKSGINRRFDPKRYDYSLDKHVEGMYTTTYHFLNAVRKDFQSYQLMWDKLEDYQKANVKRSAVEFAYMVAAAILLNILTNLADDDDDNWALNFSAYQANRFYTDMSFFANPNSAFQIIKSPMAGIKPIQQLLNFVDVRNTVNLNPWGDEEMLTLKRYKSGPHKGEAKGYVAAKRLVPVIGNIERLLTPEEQLKFFTQPSSSY